MKKIYIDTTKKDWLDEYDFYRDVVGIIEEIFIDDEIYREAMEEEEA